MAKLRWVWRGASLLALSCPSASAFLYVLRMDR